MSRVRELLRQRDDLDVTLCAELDTLLAPAGLRVRLVESDGIGYTIKADPVNQNGAGVHAGPTSSGEMVAPEGRPRNTLGTPSPLPQALERAGDETLASLLQRVRPGPAEGPGGIRTSAVASAVALNLLAGTLVGDTMLALTHLGQQADAAVAMEALGRQLEVFRAESGRLGAGDDLAPFLRALELWAPARVPRGEAFLNTVAGGVHA